MESLDLVLLKIQFSKAGTVAENCSLPPQQSSAWHSQCQYQHFLEGQPQNHSTQSLQHSFRVTSWTKRPNVSLCRPTATLTLPTSRYTCTHMHTWTRQHTHVPSPLTRGGANEKEGGAAHQLLSVPCCYLRSCMLLSWAMFSLLL